VHAITLRDPQNHSTPLTTKQGVGCSNHPGRTIPFVTLTDLHTFRDGKLSAISERPATSPVAAR
ncbi:MAG: hypothetical protein WB763_17575, partial [Terriglobia bacterium]